MAAQKYWSLKKEMSLQFWSMKDHSGKERYVVRSVVGEEDLNDFFLNYDLQ